MMGAATSPTPPPNDAGTLIGQIVPWAIVLIVLLVIAFFGLTWLSRRLGPDDSPTENIGFTLQDLRAMRDRGELTEQEFLKARSHMIEQVDPPAPASKDPE